MTERAMPLVTESTIFLSFHSGWLRDTISPSCGLELTTRKLGSLTGQCESTHSKRLEAQ